MAFTTPQEYANYYAERVAYWTAKHEKFVAASKKARAKRRIEHYNGKLAKLKEEHGVEPETDEQLVEA